jgi:hypothetical protein
MLPRFSRRARIWPPPGWGWLPAGALAGVLAVCGGPSPVAAGDWKCPPPMPAPLGTYVRAFQKTQTTLAEADDFVLYEYEWAEGSTVLSHYGQNHLMSLLPRIPSVPFPVLIQAHPSVTLNQLRRQAIVKILLAHGIGDAEMRVKVGLPEAEGLDGEEAVLVHDFTLMNLYYSGAVGAYGGGFYGGMYPGIGIGFGSALYGGGFYGGLRGFGVYGGLGGVRGPFGY